MYDAFSESEIERHPLEPFLPNGAKVLMLGSFPPGHKRWSMEFFYPNFQNDMWRIMGVLFYGDKDYFVEGKRFSYERVVRFCTEKGIAIFDTAVAVRRLKGNASDASLEIVERTDIAALLSRMPQCDTIVSTGGKSAEEVSEQLGCTVPAVGKFIDVHFSGGKFLGQLDHNVPSVGGFSDVHFAGRDMRFYRMPSSSRAYPMRLEKKVECYSSLVERLK